jgi:hypothetical protein
MVVTCQIIDREEKTSVEKDVNVGAENREVAKSNNCITSHCTDYGLVFT